MTYRMTINEGQPDQETKDIEISEKDKIWVENRHRHMKDTIDKLMSDFQRFIADNPNFTRQSENGANSLNAIKDMLAGLPQFQEMKVAYALHLGMAQESMNRFQRCKLPDLASVEQILATGLDEDYKKPKGLADQVVRMLDEDDVTPPDRLRLLALYLLYRDGLLPADLQKLLAHAQLPPQDESILRNLELLGARTSRHLKDSRPPPPPLFPTIIPRAAGAAQDELALSRYEPALQHLLQADANRTLDSHIFPYTKPPLDDLYEGGGRPPLHQTATSLRTAKPTWAKGPSKVSTEARQRVIVFVAGGATYAESRACYSVGAATSREIYLVTSHMLTPALFLRQLGDLSADRRKLGIPAEGPQPSAPAHLFEPDPVAKPPVQQPAVPPTQAMAGVNLNGAAPPAGRVAPGQQQAPVQANSSAKLTKEPPAEKEKKRHRFGFGKKS